MDTSTAHHNAHHAHTPARAETDLIGRVVAVSGSQATVELNTRNAGGEHPTVGKFMGMVAGKAVIIGLVTDIGEQAMLAPASPERISPTRSRRATLRNICPPAGAACFQRGVME